MANRRMFSRDIVDTDPFLDMPISAQLLYFHFGVRADDDGFISSPKRIASMVGCAAKDIQTLIDCGYIVQFDSGVIAILHWKVNNYLRPDRYHPTIYQKERKLLESEYAHALSTVGIPCDIPTDNRTETQIREGKSKKGKARERKIKSGQEIRVYFPGDELLNKTFSDYVLMRDKIRKPMTEKAIELAIKKLKELAPNPLGTGMDTDLAIQILERSILNSWQGLFPIKGERDQHQQNAINWEEV